MANFTPIINQPFNPKPNWLASTDGIRVITYMLKSSDFTADSNGKKIVKSGQVIPSNDTNAKGLLYSLTDVDVTDGDQTVALMIGGRVIESRLPDTISSNAKTALKTDPCFIVFESMATTIRTDEYVAITPLDVPTNIAYNGADNKITWTAVEGATAYEIYIDGAVTDPAIVTTNSYSTSELDAGDHTITILAVRGSEKGNPATYSFKITA